MSGWFQIYNGEKHIARVDPGMKVRFNRTIGLSVDRAIHGGMTADTVMVPAGTVLEYVGQYYWGSDPGPGWPKFKHGDTIGYTHDRAYAWGCFKDGQPEIVNERPGDTKTEASAGAIPARNLASKGSARKPHRAGAKDA